MSRILVLYASHFGQTRAIADRIGARLTTLGNDVDVVDIDAARVLPSPADYDAVLLGSRVEVGRHAANIRAYIHARVDELRGKTTAFFSVSMAASHASATDDPNGYLAALFTDVNWTPTRAIAFAGALPYRKYSWWMRWIMKRISKSAGATTDTSRNHEYTDWMRVESFADEIGTMLAGPEVGVA